MEFSWWFSRLISGELSPVVSVSLEFSSGWSGDRCCSLELFLPGAGVLATGLKISLTASASSEFFLTNCDRGLGGRLVLDQHSSADSLFPQIIFPLLLVACGVSSTSSSTHTFFLGWGGVIYDISSTDTFVTIKR